jgi:hypothetical protein
VPSTGLDRAWTSVERALPKGWNLSGVARGPRLADPLIHGDEWVAWARSAAEDRHVDPHRADGRGPTAAAALEDLARQLHDIAGELAER